MPHLPRRTFPLLLECGVTVVPERARWVRSELVEGEKFAWGDGALGHSWNPVSPLGALLVLPVPVDACSLLSFIFHLNCDKVSFADNYWRSRNFYLLPPHLPVHNSQDWPFKAGQEQLHNQVHGGSQEGGAGKTENATLQR